MQSAPRVFIVAEPREAARLLRSAAADLVVEAEYPRLTLLSSRPTDSAR